MNKGVDLLVVDDEPHIQSAIRRALATRLDVSIRTVSDPYEAVALLAAAPPKVLITDFRMPGLDGLAVLQEARRVAPETVRVLLTAQADREHVIDAINLGKIFRFVAKPWNDDELASIVREGLAAFAATRVTHANHRLRADVARLGEIQRAMLPGVRPSALRGEVACTFHPAEHISGDYVDAFPVGRNRTALLLGDVCGHGIGVALFVFTARALLRSSLADGIPLDTTLTRVNRFLCRDMGEGRFMTLFAGIHDAQTGILQYANAGQAFPFVVRHEGVEELGRTALPLGLTEDADYTACREVPFDEATLFAFSDGLVEARDADGELFGEEAL
ncbi:MAG: fused response regulator/phosphatase, partial [Planctomycetota bacterium]|nr:fused response regulator/phosphatase [Planctomycetota bacterium]